MDVKTLLKGMVEREASDMYLTVDIPPTYRVHGSTKPTGDPPFTNETIGKSRYCLNAWASAW